MKIRQSSVLLFLLVFCLTCIFSLSSCKKDDTNPVTSPEEKENIKNSLDTATNYIIAPNTTASILAGIWIPSKDFSWLKGYSGNKTLSNYEVSEKYIFEMNKFTDAFMAALTLRLIDEKKLALTDTIGKFFVNDTAKGYYKEDKNLLDSICVYNGKSYGRQITVKMLLNHTSGIPEYDYEVLFIDYSLRTPSLDWNKRDIISIAMKNRQLTTEPGKYSFSKTNYTLLELILENITGTKISKLMKDYIFTPCGLASTYFHANEPAGKLNFQNSIPQSVNKVKFAGSALGLNSNLSDVYKFFSALNSGRLISASSAAAMLSFDNSETDTILNLSTGYGLGIRHYMYEGISAYGIVEGSMMILYIPQKKVYVAVNSFALNDSFLFGLLKKIVSAIP